MTTITYRIKQGLRALFAFTTDVDTTLARQYLNAQEYALFQTMAHAEQLHSLNVLRTVLTQHAETPLELAAAALLHDVGKARYHLAVWQKTVSVLAESFTPALFASLSAGNDLTWWRAPFMVREQHPAWGADMLKAINSDPLVVFLVGHHAHHLDNCGDVPENYIRLLARLKKADGEN
ncbi:MAG: HD domain-containing protein [Anaerolineae bacterium]|nr:HD domain-containing protein [Anaerolineae bacterium]